MKETSKWLVISGSLALGAGAAVLAGNLAGQPHSVGPGVTLNPAASATVIPGQDATRSILATADDAAEAKDPTSGSSATSAMSPSSPASASPASASPASASPASASPASASPVSPPSPVSVDSPDSPDSPVSVDSPDSPDSPESVDSPDSPDSDD
jgi:hypothetical protein